MNYVSRFNSEYDIFLHLEEISQEVIHSNGALIKKVFKHLYVINVFKNRIETRDFFDIEFEFTLSLLIESLHALSTGQTRAALLLLRSALESSVKFSMNKEREMINSSDPDIKFEIVNKNFKSTVSNYRNDINYLSVKSFYNNYLSTIDRVYNLYSDLSSVTHSNSTTIPIDINNYIVDIKKGVLSDQSSYTNAYIRTLDCIFVLLIYSARNYISRIDSYQLQSIFIVLFKQRKTLKLCNELKEFYE